MNYINYYLNVVVIVNMLPAASVPADFYIWTLYLSSALPYRAYLTYMSMYSMAIRLFAFAQICNITFRLFACDYDYYYYYYYAFVYI